MIRPWPNSVRRSIPAAFSFAVFAAVAVGCNNEPSSPTSSVTTLLRSSRSATTGITVTAATPDSATRDTTLDVTISGSGFASDAAATWALHGTPDATQVRTNSTHYVNPNKVIANITISTTAALGNWDVIIYSGKKTGIGSDAFAIKPSDPTDTWKIPLADASLALRSDRAYNDGIYSSYTSGVCNVSGKIFATTAASNSGDATIQGSAATHGKCGRQFTLVYPDGFTETRGTFNNLHELENTTYSIPIGTTVRRRLVVDGGLLGSNPSRCGKLFFGVGPLGDKGIGSDSVAVTRIDASTWQVQSQPAPNNRALCETNNQLYGMPVSFVVVSSHPLP